MVNVNCLLKSHSWTSLLLPAAIPDAIAPFAGSSAPCCAAAVVIVSRVVQGASYLFVHGHAWTPFTAVTPLRLSCIEKGGLRGDTLILSFLYSQNMRYCISLAAVSYEVTRKEIQTVVVERMMFLCFPELNFLKAG